MSVCVLVKSQPQARQHSPSIFLQMKTERGREGEGAYDDTVNKDIS